MKVTKELSIKKGQALVLAGEQGCGKSTMARAIAAKIGTFAEIDARVLESEFGLGGFLAKSVSTLIVEGLPRSPEVFCKVKELLVNETILCHRKGLEPVEVKSPNFIFCTGNTNPLKQLDLEDRRFRVVHMGKAS